MEQFQWKVFFLPVVLFVGCDGIIGGLSYDVCGVCGGNNSTCRLVSGLFMRPFLSSGYNYITDIPQHACNLNVSEVKKTSNLIAFRFKNGSFIINGDYSPSPPGEIRAAGTTFAFHRAGMSNVGGFVFSPGPISETLELLLLYRQVNPGIKYEYRVPMPQTFRDLEGKSRSTIYNSDQTSRFDLTKFADSERNRKFSSNISSDSNGDTFESQDVISDEEFKPKVINKKGKTRYLWKITSYTPCSRTCGEGTRVGIYSCVKEHDQNYIVPDKRCASQTKKPENDQLSCNIQKCPGEWSVGDWSECSVTCGEGSERRDLICLQEFTPQKKIQVDEDACDPTPPPNILRVRPCFRKPCNNGSGTYVKPYWKTSSWSLCSSQCGIGVKTRIVKCVGESDDECNASERPLSEDTCDMGPCKDDETMKWLTTEWSEKCSESCGTGIQTRRAACSSGIREDPKCSEENKPAISRNCSNNEQCGGRWFSSPWSRCSVDCDWGKQSRSLICLAYNPTTKTYSIVDDENCNEKDKPPTEQACFVKDCDPHWFMSVWSECSRTCDSGLQFRKVLCLRGDYSVSARCDEDSKPPSKQSCNTQRCLYGVDASNDSQETSLYSNSTCADEYPNCNLVVQARLCSYKYYQQYCCKSCLGSRHQRIPKPSESNVGNQTPI